MTRGKFLILNTPFNRANYKGLIGQRFDNPPGFANGAWERDEFLKMTDGELVSYWNILQMSTKMIVAGDTTINPRHTAIVGEILTERFIPHEAGKLIETVRVRIAA